MNKIFLAASAFLLLGLPAAYAQPNSGVAAFTPPCGSCSSVSTDITANPKVCSLYGDATGNATWNWAVDACDPDYCTYWYARTNTAASLLTPMGSPFVNATTGKLHAIAQDMDYTKDRGWELLQRDFGCSHVTAYPYFVLYNRYSGLMRIFINQNQTNLFSSMSVKIQPLGTPYPAVTATADTIQAAPDKYLNTTPASTIGKSVLAVSDNLGGANRWTVVEFDPSFDPNIANAVYTGTGLQFTIYGVQNYALLASINGTTVSSTSPGLNFTPSTPPTTSNGQITFTAAQEKFTTFSKDFNDIKSGINGVAKGISDYLALVDPKSMEGDVKSKADDAKDKTSTVGAFANVFGDVASLFTGGANVLKLAGDIIGLFTGGSSKKTPAAAPVYTSYNLTLRGSLTLQDIAETFILRIPGTVQTDGNNATYYQCPLGIFNLVNTPRADTVVYNRLVEKGFIANTQVTYVSYRIKDDIAVSYFDGAGLNLVSVQGAIMGQIQAGSNGKASYNPFAASTEVEVYGQQGNNNIPLDNTVNYMRPDFDANRLEITFFDTSSAHLHVFQTPYMNIECLKGQSIQVPKTTTVFLRVKAILTRKDDPDKIPILFIQDYKIDPVQGAPLTPAYKAQLLDPTSTNAAYYGHVISVPDIVNPPYANYTDKPFWYSDMTLVFEHYTAANARYADHTITAKTDVYVNTAQGVVYKAGQAIYLEPGFSVYPGSVFSATINNYGAVPVCGILQSQAFQSASPCYNTTAAGLVQQPVVKTNTPNTLNDGDSSSAMTFYPNPARETLTISGLQGWGRSVINVYDQTGRKIFTLNKQDESPTLQLNVADLNSGIYFLEIQGETKKLTHKFIIAR